MSYEDILNSLAQLGLLDTKGFSEDDVIDVLEDSDSIWSSTSGIYNRSDLMLDGTHFTHRLTASEKERQMVDIVPDLDALDLNLDDLLLANGGELEVVFKEIDEIEGASNYGSFTGPSGWLDPYSPGDLITFHREGGRLSVSRVEAVSQGEKEQQALLGVFSKLYSPGKGVEPMEIVLDALCEDPTLFRVPVLPVGELAGKCSLELRGGWLGPAGEVWEAPGKVWAAEKRNSIAERLGFDTCCKKELETALTGWSAWTLGTNNELNERAVAKALTHGSVAAGFAAWVFQYGSLSQESVEEFMTSLTKLPGPLGGPAFYVRALNRARIGSAILAEEDLRAALRRNPDYELAKVELANYYADRGDVDSYVSRLRQCLPENVKPQLDFITDLLPKHPPTGRNDPCPCGSGRKYKACCLHSPKLSSQDERTWLMYKLIRWTLRPESLEEIYGLFNFFAQETGSRPPEDLTGFIVDVATFEGGAIDDYLELRGELLSPADRSLVEAYAASRRSLFEVVEVNQGTSLTLLDLITGETSFVIEHLASLDRRAGDYLLARLVDTVDGKLLIGNILTISMHQRDSILHVLLDDPEPLDLLAWLASTMQPMPLVNFDGDDLAFCRARIQVSEPDRLQSILDSSFEDHEDGQWAEVSDTEKGDPVIKARLHLENQYLVVETNSKQRLDQVLSKLKDLLGSIEIVEESEESLDEVRARLGDSAVDEPFEIEVTEEEQAALQAHVEKLEDRWLDESIPALGGLTPKQALGDPTRRDDLIRLLNEFERNEVIFKATQGREAAGFKSARIRKKLGL